MATVEREGGRVSEGQREALPLRRIAQNGVFGDGSFIFHILMLREVLLCLLLCPVRPVVDGSQNYCLTLLQSPEPYRYQLGPQLKLQVFIYCVCTIAFTGHSYIGPQMQAWHCQQHLNTGTHQREGRLV